MAKRIAVSAESDQGLNSPVGVHFGRCPYFILVDLKGNEIQNVQAVPNPYYGQHQPGQVPGFIKEQQADVMLASGMGGRAIAFFQQYGIEAATGARGTVQQAVEQYLGNQLQEAAPCKESQEHGHGH